MSRLRAARERAADARGGVLVFVAVCLPIIIGMGGLAVDVGNWFVHKRHLQVQADAALFAAAAQFGNACRTAGSSTVFSGEVAKYGSVGSSPVVAGGYNPQIGNVPDTRMHSLINSKTFFNQSQTDDTETGDPCLTRHKMLDVKLTETDLPWFLKAASVDYINAQARAQIREKTIAAGSLPIAVPETGPKRAWALFVNEATGQEITRQRLTRAGTSNGLTMFDNADAPVTVPITTPDIGVRILLSGSTATSPQCGDQLVQCWGAGTQTTTVAGSPGLTHIRGWSDQPAGGSTAATPPQLRNAELYAASCDDAYFTMPASSCTISGGADVDFGTTDLSKVRLAVKTTGSADSTAVDMTPPSSTGGVWTGPPFTVTAASGPTSFDLLWKTGCPVNRSQSCNNPTASGTFSKVQRTFAGSDTANGTIRLLKLSEGTTLGANSFRRCPTTCSHDLVVTLGISAALRNDGPTAPAISLKLAGGGQSGSLDCDPALDYRGEFATGCAPKYKVNDGTSACPDQNTLWASPQPWPCAAIIAGAKTGQVSQALNDRVFGVGVSGCPVSGQNKWPNITPGDKRIVTVMVTSFGALTNNSGTVPITGFATFYMSGWTNGNCQNNGDDPAAAGEVVGHFMSFVDTIDDGSAGTDPCDLDALGSCTVVLTR